MKKILLVLTAVCFMTELGFAQTGGGGDKGKGKPKKPPMHNCPGKECKKKG